MKSNQLIKNIVTVTILIVLSNHGLPAQSTAAKLTGVYVWLKPVVNAILLLLTLIFAGRCLYKIAFKHQEATADIAMFVVFFIFWGLWATLGSEILNLLGVTGVAF